jgi:uncharacterized protein YcbK (DUF882 family)
VAVRTGRMADFVFGRSRTAHKFGLGLLMVALGGYGLQYANAIGDTRTITLHHVHTNEDITITYKRNGRFDDAAMQKLNWFLRDWRRNEQVTMDPNLIDLLWEVHREAGAKAPIHVVCGYRAPETNALLRTRSNGVALFSQHMSGNATDFFIPGVPVEQLRVTALRLQSGGVGYYPTSGSPFVHLDTANVRHWPRMTHDELVRVFPNERTIHIPSDGRPLAGYTLALADIERSPNHRPASQARFTAFAKVDSTHEEEDASTGSIRQARAGLQRQASLQPSVIAPGATTAAVNTQVANTTPPLPPSRPAVFEVGKVPSPPGSKTVTVPRQVAAASIFSPWPTSQQVDRVSPDVALAYAAEARYEPTPRTQLQNVQRAAPQIPPETKLPLETKRPAPAAADSTANVSPAVIAPRLDNEWLRAVVLAPSMYRFMTSTQLNPLDSRQLGAFMQKPNSMVMMTFSADPYNGMTANAFSGKAIQFMAVVNFGMQTAALR